MIRFSFLTQDLLEMRESQDLAKLRLRGNGMKLKGKIGNTEENL